MGDALSCDIQIAEAQKGGKKKITGSEDKE